ncbi:hypothetical protein AB0K71_05655 [Streptomyces syringium]|uniref:hypothetical protein n=1 Tax=Streptomyces syringium TaxID=76729 RepID=UPI00343E453A
MGRPETGETPKRNIRVSDTLWKAAKKKAKAEKRTITDVVVAALRRYVTGERLRPVSGEADALLRNHAADHPHGPVFPARDITLRTFIALGSNTVLLDSSEVSRMLRALSTAYRSPLYLSVAQELDQVADQLDLQALTALDEQRDQGA